MCCIYLGDASWCSLLSFILIPCAALPPLSPPLIGLRDSAHLGGGRERLEVRAGNVSTFRSLINIHVVPTCNFSPVVNFSDRGVWEHVCSWGLETSFNSRFRAGIISTCDKFGFPMRVSGTVFSSFLRFHAWYSRPVYLRPSRGTNYAYLPVYLDLPCRMGCYLIFTCCSPVPNDHVL